MGGDEADADADAGSGGYLVVVGEATGDCGWVSVVLLQRVCDICRIGAMSCRALRGGVAVGKGVGMWRQDHCGHVDGSRLGAKAVGEPIMQQHCGVVCSVVCSSGVQ